MTCKDVVIFILIGFALILMLGFIIHPVSAEDIPDNKSYVLVDIPQIPPAIVSYVPTEMVRISQGQEVYLNGTYDITGVSGWDTGGDNYLAYCGGYYSCYEEENPFLVKLPPPARGSLPSQYAFWIDPSIFADKLGYWYQYDEKDDGLHGNLVAFKVVAWVVNRTFTFQNGTVIDQSAVIVGNTTQPKLTKKIPLLKEKPVSDYILARGDTFTIDDNTTEKIWIFGRNVPFYDYDTQYGKLTYDKGITQTMEPGSYYLLKQYPGKNGDFDVRFYDDQIQWKSGWSNIVSIDIPGVEPRLVADTVVGAIRNTDDDYLLQKLEVQEPSVTIEGFAEIPMSPAFTGYQEYRTQKGFVSLFDVRGYTNLIPGTDITVVLDPERRTPRDIDEYTFHATAERAYEGNMSYYKVYVPIVWDDMTIGEHTLEAYGPIGSHTIHTFPISVLPEDSFRPNATVKYVLEESPWKPNLTTPTPIIVEVTKEVIKEIIKEVGPTDAQVYAQQKKIEDERWEGYRNTGIAGVALLLCGIVGFFLIRYMVDVRRRMKGR